MFCRSRRQSRMNSGRKDAGIDRRQFLAATGGGLLAAAVPAAATAAELAGSESSSSAGASALASAEAARSAGRAQGGSKRKIPIGVFDPVYDKLGLDEMLDVVSALGLEAMEIGTGGYPNNRHCPLDDLIADPAKAKAWKKKFEDKGIRVATLSCHGNAVHPDAAHAAKDADRVKKTVRLAEMLDVKVIVGCSG